MNAAGTYLGGAPLLITGHGWGARSAAAAGGWRQGWQGCPRGCWLAGGGEAGVGRKGLAAAGVWRVRKKPSGKCRRRLRRKVFFSKSVYLIFRIFNIVLILSPSLFQQPGLHAEPSLTQGRGFTPWPPRPERCSGEESKVAGRCRRRQACFEREPGQRQHVFCRL